LRWDDRQVGVAWPLQGVEPMLSPKDRRGASLEQAERFDGVIEVAEVTRSSA
jgi:dTDP-4-dehydrorhamnose 3,5-epimerase